MHSFTDMQNRTWNITVTIDAVKRVKSLLGVNLLELETGDPPLLTRLGTDIILLCDIIYVLVKPQADVVNVTDELFGSSLGGDAIFQAQKSFYEELIDFFQKLGRHDLRKAIALQNQAIQEVVKKVAQKMEEFDFQKNLDEILGKSSMN